MKAKVILLLIIGILFSSCAPATPTQESEVVNDVVAEQPATESPETQEPVITEEPVATELPTEAPTEPPLACVTLLTPIDGVEIPPVGKVTFSWTPIDEAGKYVLNIILPSGNIVPFETDQTFRDRYMEAFVAGGEYQWQVIAQDANGSEICISEVATFEKPAYQQPSSNTGGDDGGNGNGGSGGGDSGPGGGNGNGGSGGGDSGPGGGTGGGCGSGDPNCKP